MRPPSFAACILLGLAAAPPPPPAGDPPSNVLIILADDLGQDWLGVYGLSASPPLTPNIDALAADGVRFNNVWSYPMCSPTRATVQTGRYGFRSGVGHIIQQDYGLPQTEVTLPEIVDIGTSGGYDDAFFGKWHLGNDLVGGLLSPNFAGWSHFAGNSASAGSLFAGGDYFNWNKVTNGFVTAETEYVTTVTIDDALAWIGQATEPWLTVVSLLSVHSPFHAPPASLHSVDLSGAGPPETDPVPYFGAMIEAMDTEIGRLLAGIDEETTTVIFLTDNGTSIEVTVPPFDPVHAKNSLYEGGVNVPFIVSGPDVTMPGSTCDALINTTDVFATVAELTGVDLETALPGGIDLDSVSIVPYLVDPATPSIRSTIFTEHFFPNGPTTDTLAPPIIGTYCQPDVGFGGPGNAVLEVCGDPLVDHGFADLKLSGAPPFAPSFAAIGPGFNPSPVLGATMVPFPPALVFPIVADGAGEAVFPNITSPVGGPYDLYAQMAVIDASTKTGFAFTNAVRVEFLPWNLKAIRGERYKLIADTYGGFYRFFDLEADPFEVNDLLPGSLSPTEQTEYDALLQTLSTLIGP